jgi:hypothetical protein
MPIHLQTTQHRPEIFVLQMQERRLFCTKILIPISSTTSFFIEVVENHPRDCQILSNCMQVLSTASDLVTLTEWLERVVLCAKNKSSIVSANIGDEIIPVFEYRTRVKL